MGEHQCPHCGHITTGFEQEDFEEKRHELECLKNHIAALLNQLVHFPVKHPQQTAERDAARAAIAAT